ncbi:hypothetical protein Egran_02210 [Elaphomyces granulatus]|uniref:Vacuolar protein-sorting-associated protein 25 n=1 Tax=Elaphomyces granulatus TaxID=519963 RepID=A0A232M1Q2_9EURO|nr:hypothetical protein Egran_02210 [Elaphomyces granulatus]
MTNASGSTFTFPATYSFPPFFTPQPNSSTRHSQLQKWSALIQSWCRHHRIYRLSLIDAIDTPLFHNSALRKRVSLSEARAIVDWMAKSEEDGGGGRRAEWVSAGGAGGVSAGGGEGAGGSSGVGAAAGAAGKIVAWIWWRRPEEWAELLADWVEETGQKNTVLTLYELIEGEATTSQGTVAWTIHITNNAPGTSSRQNHLNTDCLAEFHGMDLDVMLKSLNVLVKRGKAQVFGHEDQQGVKFF